jgi:hypothetical protein
MWPVVRAYYEMNAQAFAQALGHREGIFASLQLRINHVKSG